MNNHNEGLVRRALSILGRGILLGIGFGISVGAIMYVVQMVAIRNITTRTEVVGQLESGLDDLELSNLEERKQGSRDWILGTVTNNGKKTVHGVQIEADLFKGGKFVDQYSTHVSGSLKEGESRNFKISCGCGEEAPADHDAFKVKVTTLF